MAEEILELDDVVDESEEELIPYQYSITSYGADYPVDGLVKRLKNQDIIIPPFQREYIWSIDRASRFVESLLLGLPVPAIFLSKERASQKLLVIDGQQRLRSLQYFYEGVFKPTKTAFNLTSVQKNFLGKGYETLEPESRRRLDDAIIHAIIVRQDEPSEDESSIYYLFERINTGGMQLSPQEIRACIYHGTLCDILRDLNGHQEWRKLIGAVSKRMRDQELILRFFALYEEADTYKKPMKEFLNTYMAKKRKIDRSQAKCLSELFGKTATAIASGIGPRAFRPSRAVNAAVSDAVMVGVARAIQKGIVHGPGKLAAAHAKLMSDDSFKKTVETATTDEENVNRRLAIATEHFGERA